MLGRMDWWLVAAFAMGGILFVDLTFLLVMLRKGLGETVLYRVIGSVGIFIGLVVVPTYFALSGWF